MVLQNFKLSSCVVRIRANAIRHKKTINLVSSNFRAFVIEIIQYHIE
jgi:hypothetical protein